MTCLSYQDKREPGVGERDKTQTGRGRDASKEETQERAKSVETAGKYTEQALGLSPFSADTPCHQNF